MPAEWSAAHQPGEATMLLSLFYLAIGVLSILLCWLFVKACDRL